MYDIAVVGSGFAGSITAMIAKRLGLSVVLLERGRHPRFMIGESSTPLSNLLLEELAIRYDLPAIRPLTKWGSWQQHYPQVACGLKRGFTFYNHALGCPDIPDPTRRNQLLVAASPHDGIADTHWYRADLDAFLVDEAQNIGVEYVDGIKLDSYTALDGWAELAGAKDGRSTAIRARFVVDATGPRGFLHRVLNLSEATLTDYPLTEALYSHFSSVDRLRPHATSSEVPPYPVEDAAVHHVFDGGWIWMLRFNNGVTSAGVAATHQLAAKLSLKDGATAWHRLLQLIPSLEKQFIGAKAEQQFTHVKRLSFMSSDIQRERWAMLPSAAGFVDPLLSTGFPLTLLGISRLADMLQHDWQSPRFDERMKTYARQTSQEIEATARLVSALYANMNNFPVFTALSLLYFAAASFSETARRLEKPELASSFLLCDHPTFGPRCKELLARARQVETRMDADALIIDVMHAIEPLDVAGLCRQDRDNWYPVDAEDLFRGASKVNATRDDIERLLQRYRFYI
ncbi:NAD(P)/FAD-dependent oxidoreductase [Acidobacterium sp. S8]|uniref:NAD(P)/FAD-dependent oxidoreductase n=1 Tax=Acidobacterium sp. S8 TaxID=1641854 RepID=UPI0020B121B0|nr:tryptophan 7-halogenase [Acidobacterium sp. S8]